MNRIAITARDPATYRTMRRWVSRSAAQTTDPPWFLAHLIEEVALNIGRSWRHRYSVPFPTPRIEWTASPETPDPERTPAA